MHLIKKVPRLFTDMGYKEELFYCWLEIDRMRTGANFDDTCLGTDFTRLTGGCSHFFVFSEMGPLLPE